VTGPLKSSFPPVWREDARVLILGSLPGERSLAEARYYAHPMNQFWRLIGSVLGVEMPTDYPARLQALRAARVALWDVVAQARRLGSLDGAIREHRPNDLVLLIEHLPQLRAIGFNGGAAARIGRRTLAASAGHVLLDLPSSSPAFTRPIDQKLAAWLQLRRFLDLGCSSAPLT
jgi:hypoxanthine-DNA glycosylase